MNFQVVRQHFAEHRLHMAGCLFAVVLVMAAVILSAPVLAILGALMCGGMMVMMVWMMVSTVGKHRH
jgi:hypothetical protein